MGDDAEPTAPARAHRRRLLFIPGYDPRHPAVYHRLWKDEAPRQGALTGAGYVVGRARAGSPLTLEWTVTSVAGGREARTRVTLLRWDDLVRKWWVKGDWRTMATVPVWSWKAWRMGILALIRRGSRPLWLGMIAPFLLLVLLALATAAAAALAARLSPWAAVAVLLAAPFGWRWVWRVCDRRLNCGWISQCLSYADRLSAGRLPEQAERTGVFANLLLEAADDPETDEVVLAGFSLGANVAARVMGRALERRPDLGAGRVRVGLLTLGQSLAVYANLPGDPSLGDDLRAVAATPHVAWVDCTSASDPASACTLHPMHGLAEPAPDKPERRPPRFHRLLDPERFRAVRRDPLAFHFHYLKSVDQPDGYDWFAMAAGPDLLSPRKTIP